MLKSITMIVVTQKTIENRINAYEKAFPTRDSRRELALKLITPNADIPTFDEMNIIRYQLSLLWTRDTDGLFEPAKHLWTIPPAISENAGKLALIFNTETVPEPRLVGAYDYTRMHLGRLAAEPEPQHRMYGKLSATASPSPEGIKAPYVRGSVSLPFERSINLTVDRDTIETGAIAKDLPVPYYESITHTGPDADYAEATSEVHMRAVLAGTTAVRGYLRQLSSYTKGPLMDIADSIA